MQNKIFVVDDCEWFIGVDKNQVIELYKRDYDDNVDPDIIEECTNLDDGFWSSELITEDDRELLKTCIKERRDEDGDTDYEPREDEEFFLGEDGQYVSGSVRRYNFEFQKYITFREYLEQQPYPVSEAEYVCGYEW